MNTTAEEIVARDRLEVLLDAWPDPLTAEQLATEAEYSIRSSSFANALGRLRTLQLAEGGRDAVRATDSIGEHA